MGHNLKMLTLVLVIIHLANRLALVVASSIGVCYGKEGENLPSPSEVVSMCKANHIKRIRLYEPDYPMLKALSGSKIEVMIGVKNEYVKPLAENYILAEKWVEENIKHYWSKVIFRYIAVGNEIIPGRNACYVLPAIKNLRHALKKYNFSEHIKVSTVVSTSIKNAARPTRPPSTCFFSSESRDVMGPIGRYLSGVNSPLLANIHPYFAYLREKKRISINNTLFVSSNKIVKDGKRIYQNLFDVLIDGLYASLEKVGAMNVSIVVSETGWPSVGAPFATKKNAETYYMRIVNHVSLSRGTPRRPRKIETYLYEMFSEDKKLGAEIERHWGLFSYDMKPVYPINFE